VIPVATVDPVAAIGLGWTIFVGILGGIIGGVTTGVIIGLFFGNLRSRVDANEKGLAQVSDRLRAGDNRFDTLVELAEKAKVVSREIDALSTGIERMPATFQTKDLCAERHRLGQEIGEQAGKLVSALTRLSDSIDKAKGLGLASRQE